MAMQEESSMKVVNKLHQHTADVRIYIYSYLQRDYITRRRQGNDGTKSIAKCNALHL